jgi:dCTP deaminase
VLLTGREIVRQRELGGLRIDPFELQQVNPVSYNYRLGPVLKTHRVAVTDTRAEHELDDIVIGEDGLVLRPGRVYLGTTAEVIGSDVFVPSLIGRSSLGRLGVFLQFSADLGQVGSCHRWTLEIKVIQPTRVYAGMRAGQVTFWTTVGAALAYTGRFGRLSEATVPPAGLLAGIG